MRILINQEGVNESLWESLPRTFFVSIIAGVGLAIGFAVIKAISERVKRG